MDIGRRRIEPKLDAQRFASGMAARQLLDELGFNQKLAAAALDNAQICFNFRGDGGFGGRHIYGFIRRNTKKGSKNRG